MRECERDGRTKPGQCMKALQGLNETSDPTGQLRFGHFSNCRWHKCVTSAGHQNVTMHSGLFINCLSKILTTGAFCLTPTELDDIKTFF